MLKNKTMVKLMLDIIMAALFLILIDPKNTGFTFHEIAGLTMGALFLFHVVLNWNWVRSMTKNLFNPKLKTRFKWYYVLNTISLISVLTIIITGINISAVLFPSGAGGTNHSLVILHKWVSYFCLGLFGVHLVLHWRFIWDALRKLGTGLKIPRMGKAALSAGASALVLYMLYSQVLAGLSSSEDRIVSRRDHPSGRPAQVYEYSTPEGSNGSTSTGTDSSANQSKSGSTSTGTGASANQSDSSSTSIGNGSSTTGTETGSSKSSDLSNNSSTGSSSVTLNEYLSKMFCSGCEKHCSLLNPQCDKSTRYVQQAKAQYQQLYGTTVALD